MLELLIDLLQRADKDRREGESFEESLLGTALAELKEDREKLETDKDVR